MAGDRVPGPAGGIHPQDDRQRVPVLAAPFVAAGAVRGRHRLARPAGARSRPPFHRAWCAFRGPFRGTGVAATAAARGAGAALVRRALRPGNRGGSGLPAGHRPQLRLPGAGRTSGRAGHAAGAGADQGGALMRTEDDLRAALVTLERHAPSADTVLRAVRDGAGQRGPGAARRWARRVTTPRRARSPRWPHLVAGLATAAAVAGLVVALLAGGASPGAGGQRPGPAASRPRPPAAAPRP